MRTLLSLCLCSVLGASAAKVADLYEASVAADSRGTKAQTAQLREAMKNVLVKVSGTTDVLGDPNIQTELKNPQGYLRQFSYIDEGTKLTAEFNARAVDSLLKSNRWSIWDATRPYTLLLVMGPDGQVLTDEHQEWAQSLRSASSARGLPVGMPLMDFEDQVVIAPANIRSRSTGLFQHGLTRYQADCILIGTVAPGSDASGVFTLFDGERLHEFSLSEATVGELARSMVENTSQYLASRFATSNQQSEIKVIVEGIRGLSDHAAVQSELQRLKPTEKLYTMDVEGTRASYMLQVNGSLSSLLFAAGLSDNLKVKSEQPVVLEYVHG